jgi:uncharacterized phiE125 gp8 family phage protein
MMLTELTAVPGQALPVLQFRDHLRLSTGFPDESAEDGLLEAYLRAALAAVEAWTGKALVVREFAWQVEDWGDGDAERLPVAPVREILSVTVTNAAGSESPVEPARYRLRADRHSPALAATGASLPTIPSGGQATVTFRAGFGAAWAEVPPDLAHAVILLAAYYYEYRHDARETGAEMPFGVTRLLSAWKRRRIGRGVA